MQKLKSNLSQQERELKQRLIPIWDAFCVKYSAYAPILDFIAATYLEDFDP